MTEPLDLAAILEDGPPQRVAVLDLARFSIAALGVGEVLELSRALGIEPDDLGKAMRGSSAARGELAVALAWVIARRREPELELADVRTWKIEVRGGREEVAGPPGRRPTSRRRSGPSVDGPSGSSGSPESPA